MKQRLIGKIEFCRTKTISWVNRDYLDIICIYDKSDHLNHIEIYPKEFYLIKKCLNKRKFYGYIDNNRYINIKYYTEFCIIQVKEKKYFRREKNLKLKLDYSEVLNLCNIKFGDLYLENIDEFEMTIAVMRLNKMRRISENCAFMRRLY